MFSIILAEEKIKAKSSSYIDICSFGGGGVLGISHIGVWKALKENKMTDNIKIVSGSSIGALMATGAALNCDEKSITHKLLSRDIDLCKFEDSIFPDLDKEIYSSFPDGTLLLFCNMLEAFYAVYLQKGICRGEYIENVIKDIIKQTIFGVYQDQLLKQIEIALAKGNSDLNKESLEQLKIMINKKGDVTFLKLHQLKQLVPSLHLRDLYITATNMSTSMPTLDILSYETTPNMPIHTAVHASMAFPIKYATVQYEEKTYIDGGFTCNMPYEYFKTSEKTKDKNILCVAVGARPQYIASKKNMSASQYIFRLFSTMALASQEVNRTNKDYSHFLHLNIRGIPPFDFSLSVEKQRELIDKGYTETTRFIQEKMNDEFNAKTSLKL